MKKILFLFILLSPISSLFAQVKSALTIDKIMQDPKWMGISPSNIQWDTNSQLVYFNWNPDKTPTDEMFQVGINKHTPVKVSVDHRKSLSRGAMVYNNDRTKMLFERAGDLFLYTLKTSKESQLTNTVDRESNPSFSKTESKVIFQQPGGLSSHGREY